MDFENNWVYPFPDRTYDPKLKVCIRYWANWGPEPETDSARFAILGVPHLADGVYSEPLSRFDQKQIAKYGASQTELDKLVPIDTYKSFNIKGSDSSPGLFEAHRKIVGTLLRVYLFKSLTPTPHQPNNLKYLKGDIENIKKHNSGLVQSNTEDFLIYTFRNLINLESVRMKFGEDSPYVPIPNVKQVDICMQVAAMTEIFHLRHENYKEVESGWHQLAVKDVIR
jgi:hypothetical protein